MSVQLYTRGPDRASTGLLTSWSTLSLIQRRNDVGRWLLTLRSKDDAALLAPGSGLIIRRDGEYVDSGWRWPEYRVRAEGSRIEWTIAGDTDTVIMDDTLCWPQPSQPIEQQTDLEFVTARDLSAVDRVRAFWDSNVVNRLQVPGTVAGTQTGFGPPGRSRARFKNLLELAREICGTDVNFRVEQRDSDRALDLRFWLPADLRHDVQFSPDVGTVHSWEFTDGGPDATRLVIGCGNEDDGREFRARTAAQAGLVGSRESDWGDVRRVERMVDARDIRPDDEDTDVDEEAAARGDAELTETRRQQSFSIDISDTPDQQFGTHFSCGDLVRAYALDDLVVDDLVEQVEWTVDADGAERTKVWVGPVDDPDERDARRERDLRRMIKNLEARL